MVICRNNEWLVLVHIITSMRMQCVNDTDVMYLGKVFDDGG